MEYISTRNTKKKFTFKDIFLNGLASDGGLYVPRTIPSYSLKDLDNLKKLSYEQLAAKIILNFCSDQFSESELKDFLETPWKREVLHPTYQNSFLHMYPAPEYGTGEVLLASLYRNVGLNLGEGQVPKHGRAFSKNLQKRVRPDNNKSAINIDNTEWERLITRSLSSPKQPNQAKNRFLQINPIVPDAAIYSLSARLTGNPWNPGLLVANALCYGAENDDKALELWQEIFDHLSIDEDGDDVTITLADASVGGFDNVNYAVGKIVNQFLN